MPFLEHLEELRWRILWTLIALLLGTLIGFWLVEHFDVIGLLKRPIAPFLPSSGRLYFTHPTDAIMVIFKLSIIMGIVLASPVITWQAWAFFSPALYAREKRYIIPVLFGGLVLFIAGVMLAYLFVLPAAFRILLGFQPAEFEPIITADNYFGFALQLILAFGLAFELPLVIMVLSLFGVVTPKFLSDNRRYWVVIAALAAAVITPTPDAMMMLVMMVPLLLLYELGILLARLVGRRREESPAGPGVTVVLCLVLAGAVATPARAQVRPPPRQGTAVVPQQQGAQDTAAARRAQAGQAIDTASARRMGLPTSPTRPIPAGDSVMNELLQRKGFQVIRYAGDSVTFHADTRNIDLSGSAVVEQEGSTLEADSVRFAQTSCQIVAGGAPKLFDQGTVLVGEGMTYDTCLKRGVVTEALTKFNQSGVDWFMRGKLSIDSASTRIYADRSTITSSDLPLPDYHFSAGKVKWVSNTLMVARPAVLYVRDVPVLWLPFIFQDMHRGRRSGMLTPRFGINDIVRSNPRYRRHVSNVGYYFAINDYFDVQTAMDWQSGQSITLSGQTQYRWLNRFIVGSLNLTQVYDVDAASRSLALRWDHNQDFDIRTRLRANIDYASSARVLQRNRVGTEIYTANLRSAANFSKQLSWGTLSLGGDRSQELSSGVVTLRVPSLSLAPAPINLSNAVTWSPSFSFSNDRTSHQPAGLLVLPPVDGVPVADSVFSTTENSNLAVGTPFRIGRWNVPLNFSMAHTYNDRADSVRLRDPGDTTRTITRYYGENFSTQLDWSTSVGLPTLFNASWKLQPSVGIQNSVGGAFAIRNRFSGGSFVTQGKRLSFSASVTPSLFGFFPGIGPLSRIRHSVSPSLRWSLAPSATVPEAYARALDPTRPPVLTSPRTHTLSLGISQTFEGKFRSPNQDSTANPADARKIKLLSIQSDGMSYDFEKAKLPGQNGWLTQAIGNTFTSELLPGFSISTNHDLWEGVVGSDTSRFRPFLTSVSARFSLSSSTLRGLGALLTGKRDVAPQVPTPGDTLNRGIPAQIGTPLRPGLGVFDRRPTALTQPGSRKPFIAAVTFDYSRARPGITAVGLANRSMGLGVGFSPTRAWSATWDTRYDFTAKQFQQHTVRLERDLRRWRATFGFTRDPVGSFSFDFFVTLLDQPEIKFQYDQETNNR